MALEALLEPLYEAQQHVLRLLHDATPSSVCPKTANRDDVYRYVTQILQVLTDCVLGVVINGGEPLRLSLAYAAVQQAAVQRLRAAPMSTHQQVAAAILIPLALTPPEAAFMWMDAHPLQVLWR